VGICIPAGTADATGEKSSFQAKNGFFHSGVSSFALALSLRFPLGIGKMSARRTPKAIVSPAGDRLAGHNDFPKTAWPQRIQRNRKQHQHRAPARVFEIQGVAARPGD